MAEPVISTSDPAEGATDVFVNVPLDVTFVSGILESSVSSTSVTLQDIGAAKLVSISVELISASVIRITPIGALAEDTLWKIRFPGTDIAVSSNYVIKGTDSTALTSTLSVTFRTGSRTYIDDTKIDKDAADLSLEGDLNLPVHVKALGDLALKSVIPKNHSYEIDVGSSIVFTFNQTLSSGDFSQDWLEIDVYPLLDSEAYLSSGNALGSGNIPEYSIANDSADITVTFSGELPQNAGIDITISEDIVDTDGSEFGPNSYLYSVTTERYPSVSGIHVIHRELKAISEELTNEYITAILFSSTIRFMSRFSTSLSSHKALRWITARSIVDILDDKELEKAIVAGTRRQLGDMSISIDPIIGALALKHARAEKEIADIAKGLSNSIAKSYSLYNQSNIKRSSRLWFGINHKLIDARFIYYQPDMPASNIAVNRGAKIPPSLYFP